MIMIDFLIPLNSILPSAQLAMKGLINSERNYQEFHINDNSIKLYYVDG